MRALLLSGGGSVTWASLLLVKEAALSAFIRGQKGATLVQLVRGEEGISLATSSLEEEVDVADMLQGWLERPNSNLGLLLLLPPGSELQGLPKISVHLQQGRRRRSRRSSSPSNDCSSRKDNRCCRDDMMVDLTKLQGFEFIFEPTQFNAHMCSGRCPARFLPMNDHSLLQSLLHLQSHNNDDATAPRIKRPCCVPSKYESINILHLDPDNATKLKVTQWKSIVVTQCACG